VIFTIAPLLGLIGTVTGLVTIFGSFGTKAPGPEQAQMIAKGISEALNTTIAGLAVAVPAYIFQSFFSRKLEGLALRMSTLTTGLISAAYRTDVEEIPPPPQPPASKKSDVVVIHPEPEAVEGDPANA
jgi:biopolymer transport protein ExbB